MHVEVIDRLRVSAALEERAVVAAAERGTLAAHPEACHCNDLSLPVRFSHNRLGESHSTYIYPPSSVTLFVGMGLMMGRSFIQEVELNV